jgi:hypothetical protein
VKPVADKHFMTEAELEAQRKLAQETVSTARASAREPAAIYAHTPVALVLGAWLAVGLPLCWGAFVTLEKAWVLFR